MGTSLFLFSVNHIVIAASTLGNCVGMDFLTLPEPLLILAEIFTDALIHFERVPEEMPYSL